MEAEEEVEVEVEATGPEVLGSVSSVNSRAIICIVTLVVDIF